MTGNPFQDDRLVGHLLRTGNMQGARVLPPKPTDLPADTTSFPVADLRLTAFVAAMSEIAGRLETASVQAALGKNGAYEFFGDLEDALETWAQDIRNAIAEVA